jgi:hypothetical protein
MSAADRTRTATHTLRLDGSVGRRSKEASPKKALTLHEHRVLGDALKAVYWAGPLAARGRATDRLRCKLDSMLFSDFPRLTTVEGCAIYYGATSNDSGVGA